MSEHKFTKMELSIMITYVMFSFKNKKYVIFGSTFVHIPAGESLERNTSEEK